MNALQGLSVERKVFSVSDLTRNVRFVLEENFSGVWVEGEVSNFKLHTSGHMYFSLKDEEAQIQAVMFRRENQRLDFELKEGLKVVAFGRISVYPIRGQYQFYAEKIEPKGLGALQLKFQQLKDKLNREGLFDEARKKPLPFLPKRIGIVTSVDGAALHDILTVLDRRFADVDILICPVPVQGPPAAPAIAEAVEDLNRLRLVDVMIVGRGGGSLEDLWAFNEEIVARAISASAIPVISAVGHEIDFTIADFVADLRAATPSAAAELVMPVKEELLFRVSELQIRLNQNLLLLLKNLRGEWDNLILFKKEKIMACLGKLEALGPLATLKRGFSVTFKIPEGKPVRSFRSVKVGDQIQTKLSEGFLISQVKEAHA